MECGLESLAAQVRMMGRSPSHITLECANETQPNVALIGEEIEARRLTLAEVVSELADAVEARARNGKHFGIVLIPEGECYKRPDAVEPHAQTCTCTTCTHV